MTKKIWTCFDSEGIKDNAFGVIASSFLVFLFVGLLYVMVRTTEVKAVVISHSWERVQHIEVLKRGLVLEGWDLPTDAYDIQTSTRLHHYDTVTDESFTTIGSVRKKETHYRKVPVNRTYYLYKVDRWFPASPRVVKGSSASPEWPSVELYSDDLRLGERVEVYNLSFEEVAGDGETKRKWQVQVNEEEWNRWKDGQRVLLVVSSLGVRAIKEAQ